jgi:NADH-quinone oxidoreductase subunit N
MEIRMAPVRASRRLLAYFVTTLAAFGILTVLSEGDRDTDALEEYRGLFWQRPLVLAALTLLLVWLGVYPMPLIRMIQEVAGLV